MTDWNGYREAATPPRVHRCEYGTTISEAAGGRLRLVCGYCRLWWETGLTVRLGENYPANATVYAAADACYEVQEVAA